MLINNRIQHTDARHDTERTVTERSAKAKAKETA